MVAQAFFYNAIFFTFAQVLQKYYHIPAHSGSLYLFVFALGNACGPILIGHLFDTVGRKPMIAGTYALSGILLAITGWMFNAGMLTATTQTVAWTVIFFIASSAASSAYLLRRGHARGWRRRAVALRLADGKGVARMAFRRLPAGGRVDGGGGRGRVVDRRRGGGQIA